MNDAEKGEVDYYVTEVERSSTHEYERSSEMNKGDVTENEIRPRPASSRDVTCPLNKPPSAAQFENDVTSESNDEELVYKGGADITVPGVSEKVNCEDISSPRGGKFNLRPNPTPKFTDEYRY